MKKKLCLILICGVVLLGICGCSNNNVDNENNLNQNKSQILNGFDIIENSGNYYTCSHYYQKVDLKCHAFSEISDISSVDNLFITKDGSLYEYSIDKLYSTTNENCKKIDTNKKFVNFLKGGILADDNVYYIYNYNEIITPVDSSGTTIAFDSEIIKNANAKDKKNITHVSSTDEITLNILENNNIYQYKTSTSIYTIDRNEIIFTIPDDEKIEYIIDEVIKTNKNYYNYVLETENEEECKKYKDIDCIIKPTYKTTSIVNKEFDFYNQVRFYKPQKIVITNNNDIYLTGIGG
ncbi:MAG: hypothetical protein ACI33S_00820 [Bacilli bacterium]